MKPFPEGKVQAQMVTLVNLITFVTMKIIQISYNPVIK